MAEFTTLGPGSYTLDLKDVGSPVDYAGEALNFSLGHQYKSTGESRTMWSGDVRGATETRDYDQVTIEHEFDLTASGLYKFLQDNDGAVATIVVTPKTGGASWSGDIYLKLPDSIGADEFGAPVQGSVTFNALSNLTFTAAA
jgi:hypothetical protein